MGWFTHWGRDAFWRNGTNWVKCCVLLPGTELARKDREIIRVNTMKTKKIKTVITVQAIQRPPFCGVLVQFLRVGFKRQVGREWRVKSASGNSGPFCSGYIPLLPDHPFNTWLAFSELSALWTCRQAGLIWECTQFSALAGEFPAWAEKMTWPIRLAASLLLSKTHSFPFAAPHQHIALLFGFYTRRNNYAEIFVGSITMDSGLGRRPA